MYIIRKILKKSVNDPKTLDFINEVEKLTSLILDGYDMEYIKESAAYIRKKFYKMDDKKERARQLAQDWQMQLDSSVQHSWQWCVEWSARFERIGRKYGLLREFKENGIL